MRNRFPKINLKSRLFIAVPVRFQLPLGHVHQIVRICATSCAIRKIGYSSRFARFFSQGRYTADEGAPPP